MSTELLIALGIPDTFLVITTAVLLKGDLQRGRHMFARYVTR
jgi:hypothetical protein